MYDHRKPAVSNQQAPADQDIQRAYRRDDRQVDQVFPIVFGNRPVVIEAVLVNNGGIHQKVRQYIRSDGTDDDAVDSANLHQPY